MSISFCICCISFLIVCVWLWFVLLPWIEMTMFAFHIEVNTLLPSCRKEARKTSQAGPQGKPVEKQARYQSQKFSCQHVDRYVQYVRYFDVMTVGIWNETQFKKTETTLAVSCCAVFFFWILEFYVSFGCKRGASTFGIQIRFFSGFKESPLGLVEEDAGTFWMRFVTWPCLDSCDFCIFMHRKRRSWSSQPSRCYISKIGEHIGKILLLRNFSVYNLSTKTLDFQRCILTDK